MWPIGHRRAVSPGTRPSSLHEANQWGRETGNVQSICHRIVGNEESFYEGFKGVGKRERGREREI